MYYLLKLLLTKNIFQSETKQLQIPANTPAKGIKYCFCMFFAKKVKGVAKSLKHTVKTCDQKLWQVLIKLPKCCQSTVNIIPL